MQVEIKKLDPRAVVPQYGTDYSVGLDLVACIDEDVRMRPGDPAVLIPTGLAIYIKEPGVMGLILPRSGNGHKRGLVLGNTAGVIDPDYQGPLMVSAWNRNTLPESIMFQSWMDTTKDIIIKPGERIAQMIFVPIIKAQFNLVDEFTNNTDRGQGGFGSTGQ